MDSEQSARATLAQSLEGRLLDGGWQVEERLSRTDGHSGGYFSVGYRVRNEDGRVGYLKALDFTRAIQPGVDFAQAIQPLVETFNFERDLLTKCHDSRMNRVVLALDDGSVHDESGAGLPVQYIIFEFADSDVRRESIIVKDFDTAWALRVLHHVSVGMNQLHGQSIAHQDLKPSNVLVFGQDGSKIGDLGSAAARELSSPRDELTVAGDFTYAAPELLYGHIPQDWTTRRFAADLYLLGSMIVFMFTGGGMTPLLTSELVPEHRWSSWSGSFSDVLPYVVTAFESAMVGIEKQLPELHRDALVSLIRWLCDPNPENRGHPKTRAMSQQYPHLLERIISQFNIEATRAEVGMKSRV